MTSSRLPSRIAVVMILAVLLAVAAFLWTLQVIRNSMDRSAAEASVRVVEQAMDRIRTDLTTHLVDYNTWTDAWIQISAANWPWVYENYAITADQGSLMDGMVLFGGALAEPVAWTTSRGEAPQPSHLDPAELDSIRSGLAATVNRGGTVFSLLIPREGRVILAVATHSRPGDLALLAGQDLSSQPIAVFTRTINPRLLSALAAELELSQLRYVTRPAASGSFLPLNVIGLDGAAGLAWRPPQPGSDVLTVMRPVLALVLAAFLGLAVGAALLARAAAQALVRQEDRAAREARTDSLTLLPNRLAFTEKVGAFDRRPPSGHLALILLDMNGFKRINDTVGHDAGDQVVREFARRLRAAAGPTSFVARIGGDEFVVLAEAGPDLGADGFLDRMQSLSRGVERRLAEPVAIPAALLYASAAQGMAVWDHPAMTAAEMIRRADLAMYRGKAERSTQLVVYHPDMERQAREEQQIERALRRALIRPEEFSVHYQPIITAQSRHLVRAEALARWTSPELGTVPPDRFIAVAEQTGLILPLGKVLFERVAADLASTPGLTVSLNISPVQLQSQGFAAALKELLDRHRIATSRVELELTEGLLVADPDSAAFHLDALQDLGFSLALDDFGTGFSSIGYLRRMPFDKLKIDRSFLGREETAAAAPPNMALIKAVILLGHSIGKTVVFEGVETETQASLLQSLGCDLLQGYHFGRPMPLSDLVALFPDLAERPLRRAAG